MTTLWIIVPLAVLAIGIAVLPVLIGSYRHDRSVKEGTPVSTREAAREVNQWHSRLGRHIRRTPQQLEPGRDTSAGVTRPR
jgi:hypothetical protein